MAQLDGTTYWQDSSSMSRYPALDRNLKVDVAIIGAGITGLTAAYLLKRAGRTVAVIDRGRCGGVDTGHTTAHVTCVTDLDLSELVHTFGRDHAQAAWDAGLAAIAQIDTIVGDQILEIDGERVAAWRSEAGKVTLLSPILHAHGVPGRLERGRVHVGLPVPRVTVQAERRRPRRAG